MEVVGEAADEFVRIGGRVHREALFRQLLRDEGVDFLCRFNRRSEIGNRKFLKRLEGPPGLVGRGGLADDVAFGPGGAGGDPSAEGVDLFLAEGGFFLRHVRLGSRNRVEKPALIRVERDEDFFEAGSLTFEVGGSGEGDVALVEVLVVAFGAVELEDRSDVAREVDGGGTRGDDRRQGRGDEGERKAVRGGVHSRDRRGLTNSSKNDKLYTIFQKDGSRWGDFF